MFEAYEIRQLPLSVPACKAKVEQFLSERGLRYDNRLEYYAGVFDTDDNMLAGGGLAADTLRCLAVSHEGEGEGLAARLVSHLLSEASQRGRHTVSIFTKPANRNLFESMGFAFIGQSAQSILLESNPQTHIQYVRQLSQLPRKGRVGIVVMHANPMTNGHLHLCRYAAERVDTLFVMVLSADEAEFSPEERLNMVREALKPISNVQVIPSSRYAISAHTFPTYFLKQPSDAATEHMQLDLDVFLRIVAPSLGVGVRYVGSEADDALTAAYNATMLQMLPERGVEVVEIPRIGTPEPIRATRVRESLSQGRVAATLPLLPPTTWPFVLSHLATRALLAELNLTPKPGLIDLHDNGAHSDMDYTMMRRSISVLQPHFTRIAALGLSPQIPSADQLRCAGLEAERDMLAATGGINTHKGAIFALGLMLIATVHSQYVRNECDMAYIQQTIARMAAELLPATETHGAEAVRKYNLRGALAQACTGYEPMFGEWLPRLVNDSSPAGRLNLLLAIISQIDDTNIYHRGGTEAAAYAKASATHALSLSSQEQVAYIENLNLAFCAKHISPGGSADMLALTIFAAALHNAINLSDNTNN